MTVGELIAELRDFPGYLPVMLSSDGLAFQPVSNVEYLSPDEIDVALTPRRQGESS